VQTPVRSRWARLAWIAGLLALSVAGLFWHKQRRQEGARIAALRGRVYRIGADHAPPYYTHKPDGSVEGLAVEVMNRAAEQAGLRLRWVAVQGQPDEALLSGQVDLWPALNSAMLGRERLHFSVPWLQNNFVSVTLADAPGQPVIVGVRRSNTTLQKAKTAFPGAEVRAYRLREEALLALCKQEVTVAAFESRFLDAALLNRPPPCDAKALSVKLLRGFHSNLSIASRHEFAAVGDLLRQGINQAADKGLFGDALDKWSALSSSDSRALFALEEAEKTNRDLKERLWFGRFIVAAVLVLALLAYRASQRARAAQAVAEKAAQAKTDFLANVSHEIRTPLNGVIGMAALLAEGAWNESKREDLRTLQDSAHSLLGVLNDVLDFSKLEAGRCQLSLEAFDLRLLLTRVRDLFQSLARQKQLDLHLDLPSDLPDALVGDAARLRQILMNFAGNALKFTERGEVRIFAVVQSRTDRGAKLRLGVSDSGIGIPTSVRRRLFEKFEQADTSMSRQYGGTGLGLAISKRLAELMGGSVGLSSEVGVGSTFWVDVELGLAESPLPEAIPQERKARRFSGRVLVAEDNAVNRKLIDRMLHRYGIEPVLVNDGKQALEQLRARRFDLVLMDCQMPLLDGYEATRIWRAEEAPNHRIPVVAITAHAFPQDSARCRAAGMNDYLSKPLEAAAFEAVLARYLKDAPETSPENKSSLAAL
jgi:signal transduction histidine kinase/ActR/RegA family two-component response regulator